jgi:dihydropteroate synthase
MNRKIYYWKLRSVELQLGEKTLVMGILNVTPDSFSDGGSYYDPDQAYARALELEELGADIIDIGAESTRPGSRRVSAEEEWRRLVPVLKRLRDKLTIPLSLDTYKAETAERAFEYGIEIVNDPSGLTFDADLAKTAANANTGLILNHMRGTPETWAKLPPLQDMIGSVVRDLEAMINRARRAGVDRSRIAIDPGLGFGKRREQNSEILAHLRQLAALDCPILTGPSRKSFLAQSTEDETLYATAAAVAVSVMNGAHIVRVHDVKEMRMVAQVTDEIVHAADAKQAADIVREAAKEAADRPVPRRTARELDDRPRAVKPPVARKVTPIPPPIAIVENPAGAPVPVETGPVEPMPDIASQSNQPASPESVELSPPAEVVAAETPRSAKPYADRPLRREFSDGPSERESAPRRVTPPHRDSRDGTPAERRSPRRDFAAGERPPRRDSGDKRAPSGDRPPRRDFSGIRPRSGDRPPRREFGDSRLPGGDRPPRRDFGSSRPPGGDRPPRRDFSGSRPPSGDRPPRRNFGDSRPPSGDRPPRRDFSGSRPPSGDRPPRRNFGDSRPPSGDRPPRRDFGGSPPPSGDRPARRDSGGSRPPGGNRPLRRDSGPPRSKPLGGGSRPFRKRP